MLISDYKNKVIWVTRKQEQRRRIKKISGAEPKSKSGMVRLRAGKLFYGTQYTANAISFFDGRSKIKDGKNKFWTVKVLKPGQSPFLSKGKQPDKHSFMGKIKHRPSKHKFQGINGTDFSGLTITIKRRK